MSLLVVGPRHIFHSIAALIIPLLYYNLPVIHSGESVSQILRTLVFAIHTSVFDLHETHLVLLNHT